MQAFDNLTQNAMRKRVSHKLICVHVEVLLDLSRRLSDEDAVQQILNARKFLGGNLFGEADLPIDHLAIFHHDDDERTVVGHGNEG